MNDFPIRLFHSWEPFPLGPVSLKLNSPFSVILWLIHSRIEGSNSLMIDAPRPPAGWPFMGAKFSTFLGGDENF